jgi:hypothetical protein
MNDVSVERGLEIEMKDIITYQKKVMRIATEIVKGMLI